MIITCATTGESRETGTLADGSAKLPPGWKRLAGICYSPEGWASSFHLRSAHLPIASVAVGYDDLDWGPNACKAAWTVFRSALKQSWIQATQIANLAMREIAAADRAALIVGDKGTKLPKLEMPDIYSASREVCPDLDSQSVGSLLQKVKSKYRESRFDMRCRGAVSLPTYRYPVPIPVPAKDSTYTVTEQHQPFMRLRVSGQRFTVRLRNGFEFMRQIRSLEKVQVGQGAQGEVSIYRKADGQVMVAIACWLPKEEIERTDRSMSVVTGTDSVWTVIMDGREQPWILNEDHVRRRAHAHRHRMERLRQDLKFERRRPKRNQRDIAEFRETICARQERIVNDFCHKATAMLIGLVKRNRVGTVEYDGTVKHLVVPAFKLRTLLEQKLHEIGVTFVDRTKSDENATV